MQQNDAMAQLVTRIDDDLDVLLEELIAEGAVASKSDAVRRGLSLLLDRHRRQKIGAEIVDAYRRHPQTIDESSWSDEATVRMIAEEPW